MNRSLIFWVLMLLWAIFGVWTKYPNYALLGGDLLEFILFALLGWKVYGPAIKSD